MHCIDFTSYIRSRHLAQRAYSCILASVAAFAVYSVQKDNLTLFIGSAYWKSAQVRELWVGLR